MSVYLVVQGKPVSVRVVGLFWLDRKMWRLSTSSLKYTKGSFSLFWLSLFTLEAGALNGIFDGL